VDYLEDFDITGAGAERGRRVRNGNRPSVSYEADACAIQTGIVAANHVPEVDVRVDNAKCHCRFTNMPPSTSSAAPVT
jgi:hypothetical protein